MITQRLLVEDCARLEIKDLFRSGRVGSRIVTPTSGHPYRSGPSKAWLKIKNPNAPGVLRFKVDEP